MWDIWSVLAIVIIVVGVVGGVYLKIKRNNECDGPKEGEKENSLPFSYRLPCHKKTRDKQPEIL